MRLKNLLFFVNFVFHYMAVESTNTQSVNSCYDQTIHNFQKAIEESNTTEKPQNIQLFNHDCLLKQIHSIYLYDKNLQYNNSSVVNFLLEMIKSLIKNQWKVLDNNNQMISIFKDANSIEEIYIKHPWTKYFNPEVYPVLTDINELYRFYLKEIVETFSNRENFNPIYVNDFTDHLQEQTIYIDILDFSNYLKQFKDKTFKMASLEMELLLQKFYKFLNQDTWYNEDTFLYQMKNPDIFHNNREYFLIQIRKYFIDNEGKVSPSYSQNAKQVLFVINGNVDLYTGLEYKDGQCSYRAFDTNKASVMDKASLDIKSSLLTLMFYSNDNKWDAFLKNHYKDSPLNHKLDIFSWVLKQDPNFSNEITSFEMKSAFNYYKKKESWDMDWESFKQETSMSKILECIQNKIEVKVTIAYSKCFIFSNLLDFLDMDPSKNMEDVVQKIQVNPSLQKCLSILTRAFLSYAYFPFMPYGLETVLQNKLIIYTEELQETLVLRTNSDQLAKNIFTKDSCISQSKLKRDNRDNEIAFLSLKSTGSYVLNQDINLTMSTGAMGNKSHFDVIFPVALMNIEE